MGINYLTGIYMATDLFYNAIQSWLYLMLWVSYCIRTFFCGFTTSVKLCTLGSSHLVAPLFTTMSSSENKYVGYHRLIHKIYTSATSLHSVPRISLQWCILLQKYKVAKAQSPHSNTKLIKSYIVICNPSKMCLLTSSLLPAIDNLVDIVVGLLVVELLEI